jgi:uncharacterized membrane protein (UPF0127 family)
MIFVKAQNPATALLAMGVMRGIVRGLRAGLLGGTTLLAGMALAQGGGEQPQRLQAVTLTAGMHNIRAEVAITPEQRQRGLMYRRDLATHEGMLFVFDAPAPQCFWMKNTPTPLTIAFLADDGSIVNLADMKPFDEASHCSARPVRFVLEMNQGWFAKRGFKAGAKLGGAPFK